IGRDRERAALAPSLLPARLRFLEIITRHRRPTALSLDADCGTGRPRLLRRRRADPHLPRPRQDGVLDVDPGLGVHRRLMPLARAVARLAEDCAAHAVGAQLAP